MLVGECMVHPIISIPPEMSLTDALALMKHERIRRAPVIKHGKLVGIVSQGDLLNASPSDATSLSIWELNYLLSKVTVEQITGKKYQRPALLGHFVGAAHPAMGMTRCIWGRRTPDPAGKSKDTHTVGVPTLITTTPLASFASRSYKFALFRNQWEIERETALVTKGQLPTNCSIREICIVDIDVVI